MINKLIEEIEIALQNNMYLIALNTALILPDICGKAEYPTLSTNERYKKWYDMYIAEPKNKSPNDTLQLTGNVVYSLRCSLLHEGNPNVSKDKTNIDTFKLNIQDDYGVYLDTSTIITHANRSVSRQYQVNVRGLCFKLCELAKKYYSENKDKFNFLITQFVT